MLKPVPRVEVEPQAARRQLEQVLQSTGFVRNERLSRFLRFVIERHLEGRDHELKESVIGIEVFGRRPDYDPKQHPIVRTEAARLRARLSQYYFAEGKGDALIIELPKGGYVPRFHEAARAPEAASPARGQRAPRHGIRHWRRIALGAMTVALAATALWWMNQGRAPVTIAVLPLENLSQDPTSDYLADGLTDELIRDLSIIEGLVPRSRTSSFAFKGKPRNLREAGKQLAADYVLEGSVLRVGDRLRINAQLIRVRDDFPLWSGKFDRELTDVFAIQEEISHGIVNGLRLKLGRGRRRYEASPEAYNLYLRARALPIRAGLVGYDQSVALLEEAIAKDPSFAPAYAALATAHAARSGQFRFDIDDEVAKMRAAAEKAIQLDPLLAEAHDALGMGYSRDAQWEPSETSFRRAIQIDPSRSTSYFHFAMSLLLPLGRLEEALQQLRRAVRTDPLSPEVHYGLSYVLISAGRYDEAEGHCERLPDPGGERGRSECLGRVRLGQGRIGEAIQTLEAAYHPGVGRGAWIRALLGYAYGRGSRREQAEKLAAASSQNPFNQAVISAGLGDKDRAFEALDRAAVAGPFRIGRALTWPELALLRRDPRLKALRKKVGLPQ
ncbi:MAG: tetratricopeptide repeat protein [Acidobacteria bacterium]|nr:tetratricopeptide repeat protein [Acidobacteriota bacterium]